MSPSACCAELTHRCPLGCPYCSNPLALDARDRRARHRDLGARVPRGGGARRAAGAPVRRRAGRAARSRRDRRRRACGRPLHQPHHLGGRHHRQDARRARRRPASTTCRSRSRTARRNPPTTSPAMTARSRASARSPPRWCGSGCRSPSTRSCTAPISSASASMVDLALALGASRVEIAHVQYYGWALEEPRHVDADPRAGRARGARWSRSCATRHHGRIVIDAVVPDYYARYPEALRRRLGPALAQRDAGRQGAALPRRRIDPRPRVLERARAFARRYLGEFAGLQRLPRHRLDEGAVRELRRGAK